MYVSILPLQHIRLSVLIVWTYALTWFAKTFGLLECRNESDDIPLLGVQFKPIHWNSRRFPHHLLLQIWNRVDKPNTNSGRKTRKVNNRTKWRRSPGLHLALDRKLIIDIEINSPIFESIPHFLSFTPSFTSRQAQWVIRKKPKTESSSSSSSFRIITARLVLIASPGDC